MLTTVSQSWKGFVGEEKQTGSHVSGEKNIEICPDTDPAPVAVLYWPRGYKTYKTFFILNLTEHEIFPAHKC